MTWFSKILEPELNKLEYLQVIHNYVNYDSQFRGDTHMLQLDTCERMYNNIHDVMMREVLEITRNE